VLQLVLTQNDNNIKMKLSHTLVYSILSFFTILNVYAQGNDYTLSSRNAAKGAPAGVITGGSDNICVGSKTQFSNDNKSGNPDHSDNSGSWSVSNLRIATVSNKGLVTALQPGVFILKYDSPGNKYEYATRTITVHSGSVVKILGSSSICINGSTTLSPNTGGTWSSSDSAVATVSNSGTVLGISAGTAAFTFINTSGCSSLPTATVTIKPNVVSGISGTNVICVNGTTTLYPTSGGTWTSSNNAVAIVNNSGLVTGITAGTATFIFTKTDGCSSLSTPFVKVNANAGVSITGSNTICIDETTTLSPNTGGTWVSNNPAVATVSNTGVVTGVAAGSATFTYSNADGCISLPTSAVTVNANPVVSSISGGSNTISVGSTTQFINSTAGGVWSISDGTGSATVSATGLVTGTAIGNVKINYAVEKSGCKAYATPQEITVKEATVLASITGPDTVSVSELSVPFGNTTAGGVWSIKNGSGTATITSQGVVQGTQAGIVEVVYTFVDVYGVTVSTSKKVTIINNTPLAGRIIASIEKPTISDTINFSFELLETTISSKNTSSLSSTKRASSLVSNLTYKWIFNQLDNVTLIETITDPVALQRFSIPGNYRVILIVTDENGYESTFYRDVIVTQTCEPILGKIIITN
jgi:uncharacterized protein YjdB